MSLRYVTLTTWTNSGRYLRSVIHTYLKKNFLLARYAFPTKLKLCYLRSVTEYGETKLISQFSNGRKMLLGTAHCIQKPEGMSFIKILVLRQQEYLKDNARHSFSQKIEAHTESRTSSIAVLFIQRMPCEYCALQLLLGRKEAGFLLYPAWCTFSQSHLEGGRLLFFWKQISFVSLKDRMELAKSAAAVWTGRMQKKKKKKESACCRKRTLSWPL